MAKIIKAIKCPQCQSVKKEKLAEDAFLCSNCDTEYFLDNDHVHVHINHHNAPQVENSFNKHRQVIFLGLFVFLLLSITLPYLFSQVTKKPSHTKRIRNVISVPQETVENPLVLLLMSQRTNRKETFFVRFYDLLEERAFSQIPLTHEDGRNAILKTFESGKNYLIFRGVESIYEVDFAEQEFKNVTEKVLGGIPEFVAGIASIDFSSEDYGFKIFTNNGQEFFYFPEINKLMKSGNEVYNLVEQNKALVKAQQVLYIFTSKSSDFPKEKIQLVKYWYPESYPRELPSRAEWYKAYHLDAGIDGIKNEAAYDKELFNEERNIKFKDLTPDRHYFNQKIVYQDSENLYISGKESANNNAKSYVQRINTETGEIEWNFTLENAKDKFNDFQAYKNGLIVMYQVYSGDSSKEMVKVFDKNGKLLKEMNQNKLLKN